MNIFEKRDEARRRVREIEDELQNEIDKAIEACSHPQDAIIEQEFNSHSAPWNICTLCGLAEESGEVGTIC